MILILLVVGLFLIASWHIYMFERLCDIVEFKKAVRKKDYGLYCSLISSSDMLYTFLDWRFHKMIKPNFFKLTGRTKTEVLNELEEIHNGCRN